MVVTVQADHGVEAESLGCEPSRVVFTTSSRESSLAGEPADPRLLLVLPCGVKGGWSWRAVGDESDGCDSRQ